MELYFLILLSFTISGDSHSIKDFKCIQNNAKPKIHIPEDSVSHVSKNIYTVKEEFRNNSFVINCTNNQPVDWRFEGSIGNTLVTSERMVNYDWYDENKGFTHGCYYSSLTFHGVENEMTGRYVCIVKPHLGFNAGSSNAYSNEIILFSGLSAMTLSNRTETYDLNWLRILIKNQKYNDAKYKYKLPCARNHPSARLKIFYMESVAPIVPEQFNEWIEETNYTGQVGAYVTVLLSNDQLPRTYKCEGRLFELPLEAIYIKIPGYPAAVYWPDTNSFFEFVYKLPTYNVFYCISRVPIRISKNDQLPTSLESTTAGFVQHYINMGFNYTSAVTVVKRGDVPHNKIGKITCQDIETGGQMINFSWKYIWNGLSNNDDKRNGLNGNIKRADCKTSVDAEETYVRYIKASTHAELSLRQNCLELPTNEWSICNHPNPTLRPENNADKSVVTVELPPGISGAFQCLTPDVFNDKDHYAVFSETVHDQLGNVRNNEQEYIRFTSSAHQSVVIGDIIEASCTTSEMYFYGHGMWLIVWNNSTRSSVPHAWVESDNVTKVNTFLMRNSRIVLNSLDIEGITCAAVSIKRIKDNKRKIVVYPSPEYKYLNLKPRPPLLSILEITVIVLVVAVTIVLLLGIVLVRRVKRSLGKHDLVYNKMIQNFFDGFEAQNTSEQNLCAHAESQPYDGSFEILPEDLNIRWDSPLGTGAYGCVLSGTYLKYSMSGKTKSEIEVAIKTLKEITDDANLKAMMSELKVMIYIGKHENLVSLYGAITSKLSQRELYLVLEYCKNGSLYKYLRQRQDSFTDNFQILSKKSKEDLGRMYCNIQHMSGYELTSVELYKWSRQIISGMEYLVNKKVIHGDLATRNVLLDNTLTAKISDFGLSRRLYEQYEYVKQSQEPLPWRWMAIESLRSLTFSAESDVWAFGVTLWEIFSLAETPFQGNTYSPDFMTMIEQGYRLTIPKFAPKQIYHIMMKCWASDPGLRPTFSDLLATFENLMDVSVADNYENMPPADLQCFYAELIQK